MASLHADNPDLKCALASDILPLVRFDCGCIGFPPVASFTDPVSRQLLKNAALILLPCDTDQGEVNCGVKSVGCNYKALEEKELRLVIVKLHRASEQALLFRRIQETIQG